MLVLSRKPGEKIVIGDDIVITVLEIDRNKVRLGIDAPRSVPVYRQELLAETAERRAEKDCPVAALYRDEAQEGGGAGE